MAPFYGDDEEMFAQITSGKLEFPLDLFGHVSSAAVAFIRRLLQVESAARPSASEALADPWFRVRQPVTTIEIVSTIEMNWERVRVSDSGRECLSERK